MDTDVGAHIPGCLHDFVHELLHHIHGKPRGPQADGDFRGGQVHRLHGLQRLHIDGVIVWIELGATLGPGQLFPDVAGQVLVGGEILGLTVVFADVERIQKDNALNVFVNLLLRLAGELGHIGHIDLGLFTQRQGKGLRRRVHMGHGDMPLDGAFREHIRLTDELALVVQHFQGGKQEVGAVRPERGVVGAGADAPILPHKGVVPGVELPLFCLDVLVRVVLGLVLDEGTHTVPEPNQPLDAALRRTGHTDGGHAAIFPVVHFAVHDGVAVIAYRGVGRDRIVYLRVLHVGRGRVGVNIVDILDVARKLVLQAGPFHGRHGEVLLAVLGVLRGLDAQNHLRVVGKIVVDGKAVGALPQLHPCWLGQVDVVAFL